jgi:hypothetical protein
MSDEVDNSLDILGLKPLAKSVEVVTRRTIDGAAAFFSRICLPAAEELGLLLKDRVSSWRKNNLEKIAQKAEQKYDQSLHSGTHAHPRLIMKIIEEGSWVDDDDVQELWAGLIASSCTEMGDDDSNLMFIDLLARLSASQARLLNYFCEDSSTEVTEDGRMQSKWFEVTLEELQRASSMSDAQRLDRELDHLSALGLIEEQLRRGEYYAILSLTGIALHMYVRCKGFNGDPAEFYNSKEKPSSGSD